MVTAAPTRFIMQNNPTHNNSNQTLVKNTSLPESSEKRVRNVRSSPDAPRKIKYPSISFAAESTRMISAMLIFHTATLIMIALQITKITKTKYRSVFKRFNMMAS